MEHQVQHAVETITPAIARAYLASNQSNRKVTVTNVKDLAAAIRRGEWRLTHQGIAFSCTGRLLDGQHRLLAVVEAGQPITTVVSRGLPEETFMALDIGKKRSYADVLGMDKKLIEVANLCAFLIHTTSKPSPDQVGRWASLIAEPYTYLLNGRQVTTKIISSAGMRLAAILSMENGSPREYVRDMYQSLLHMDIESLPPIGRSLVAQIARESVGGRGSGRSTSMHALSRGMVVFNIAKRDATRVQVNDINNSIAWARESLHRLSQKNSASV